MIRRLKCSNCRSHHNELPDCLVPNKHYAAEVISGVIDGIVTASDEDSSDYPSFETMRRWIRWFRKNHSSIEGYLRNIACSVIGLGEEVLFSRVLLLDSIRNRYINWLERILRLIYNCGGALTASLHQIPCTCCDSDVKDSLCIVSS